jgi:hypothetical protein
MYLIEEYCYYGGRHTAKDERGSSRRSRAFFFSLLFFYQGFFIDQVGA